MRNEVVAPLLAPCLRSDTAAGKTPQDHNGMGIPKMDALSTETNRPRPRCLATELGLRNTRNNPATIKPKTIYTDESSKRCQDAENTFTIKFNLFQPFCFKYQRSDGICPLLSDLCPLLSVLCPLLSVICPLISAIP